MVSGSKRAVRSPHFAICISQTLESLLTALSVRRLLVEEGCDLTGDVTSCTRCRSKLDISKAMMEFGRCILRTNVQQYGPIWTFVNDVVLKDSVVKGTRFRVCGWHTGYTQVEWHNSSISFEPRTSDGQTCYDEGREML